MSFPDLSYARTVGQWRYIQALHERPERRNPDRLVGQLLPLRERWNAHWLSGKRIAALRSHRFYYYLVSRTRHYDEVFLDAIAHGVHHIINVGCGTDTRAYRFARELQAAGVRVCECDQPSVIEAKRRACVRRWPANAVRYLALDLGDESWPEFAHWLEREVSGPTLVLMEGLTPYLNDDKVRDFLGLLACRLAPGSMLAYDLKLDGAADDFGRGVRTMRPFRLPFDRNRSAQYHEALGWQLLQWERSDELSARLMPELVDAGVPLFREDALVHAALLVRQD